MSSTDPLAAIPRALRDATMDPERRDQDIVVDGVDVRVRYDPEPGVDRRVHVAEGAEGMTMTSFGAAAERPASYPADLPYLPGLKASVNGRSDAPDSTRGVTWWSVPDMDRALAELRAQSAAAGWTEEDAGIPVPLPGIQMIGFGHADGRKRLVHATAVGQTSMIALYDNPR
jgi:hypothetical protein